MIVEGTSRRGTDAGQWCRTFRRHRAFIDSERVDLTSTQILRAAHDVARYIVENPIRAGLATNVRDYPFIGSSVYTVAEILDGLRMSGADRVVRQREALTPVVNNRLAGI